MYSVKSREWHTVLMPRAVRVQVGRVELSRLVLYFSLSSTSPSSLASYLSVFSMLLII